MTTPLYPRALHLTVHSKGGGTETNIRRLCEKTPGFLALSLEELAAYPLHSWDYPKAILQYRLHRPQVVFCYGITTHVLAPMAWPFGVPLIGGIRCETDFDHYKGVIQRASRSRFATWISNSKMALGDLPGKVIYNGVPEPSDNEELRFPNLPRPVFGILGRGDVKKGHLFALKLWRQLGRPGSMIFAGDLPGGLRRKAMSYGVRCPGFVDPGPLLRSLDLLLVPSTAEGLPTVLLEAMIRGIPCLSAPAGGSGELIRHNKNGYLLPREQWKYFLEHIDWNKAKEIGSCARDDVRKNWTFEKMQRQFLGVARHYSR